MSESLGSEELETTPLHREHLAAGARMVPFAGYSMPVQYSGVVEEHRAVRTRAGLFDVSHMGELHLRGEGAESFLQRMTPNDVSRLSIGQAHYSALLDEAGTFLDDLLVYRLADRHYLLVVNAAGRSADLAWLEQHRDGEGIELEDRSDETALIALQGPEAETILDPLCPLELAELRYYHFAQSEVLGHSALVSRTGYTGEDGFELYLGNQAAPEVWRGLLERGAERGLVPAGLGARDTLRLEAGMMLSGQDIGPGTTPLEAGLGWIVKLEKGDFVGRSALAEQKEQGPAERIVGFEIVGRGIARSGHPVLHRGETVGRVTSGSWSPTLEKAIGLAKIRSELASPGTELEVEVRGRALPARVVELPFYRRPQ